MGLLKVSVVTKQDISFSNNCNNKFFCFVFCRKNGLIIDHWEVDGDLVTLEYEIGEGAFGKVYKGTLIKPTSSLPQKFFLKPWKKTAKTVSGSETYVVAVKVLHSEYQLFLVL